MKAIILTITGGQNFGNRLQNFALQEELKKQGLTVDTVQNLTRAEDEYKIVTKLKLSIKKIISTLYYIMPFSNNVEFNNWYRRKKFDKFTKRYISQYHTPISDIYVPENIDDEYDFFVAGSDQIWNPYYLFKSHIEFMDFATKSKRISYAASFGVDKIPNNKISTYKKWLEEIPNISVREQRGAEIVEELIGKKASVVVDPTLLLNGDEWRKIAQKPKWLNKREYILVYLLGVESEELNKKIKIISLRYNLPVIWLNNPKYKKEYGTDPAEFIYLIDNCRLLCTDSFHGTIFSYNLKTPVAIFERKLMNGEVAMNSRMNTIKKLFGIDNRVIENIDIDNEAELFDTQYNEEKVNDEIEKSRKYLRKVLNKQCKKD